MIYLTAMSGSPRCIRAFVLLFIYWAPFYAGAAAPANPSSDTTGTMLPRKKTNSPRTRKAKLVRGPYLQVVNGEGATLRWRTDMATDSKLEVGTSKGQYTLSAQSPVLTTEHVIRITGLQSDTRYYYRFGSSTQVLQDGQKNYFTTAPPLNTNRRIRVAVFGDCGRNTKLNQTLSLRAYRKHVRNHPAELMLLLGDNAYFNGLDEEYQRRFFRPYRASVLKNHALFPTPGNHEYANNPARQQDHAIAYYSIFSVPERGECGGVPSGSPSYYSYNWGNIHFVSLDSYGEHDGGATRLYDTSGAQARWLKRDLVANKQPWTIVYFHHPPYTMGSHNSDREAELVKIRQSLLPLLERYGVDMVLNGHSHNYERSYPMKGYYGDEASFDADKYVVSTFRGSNNENGGTCIYETDSRGTDRGTVYVVSGSSGASGAVQKGYPHNAMPFSQHRGGMFYFEVEGARLDAFFLRKNGTTGDRFTLIKDSFPKASP